MLNKVMLIGNLGNDPEIRHLPSGGAVCQISIATTMRYQDKQTGEKKEKTEWHRVVFFNRLAEIAGEYLKKGSKVYVEGRLQTRKWQDQQGADHYSTEIVANEMHMLGDSRPGDNAAQPKPAKSRDPGAYNPPPSHGPDDFDDDIPF